jgi:hypothetical protein
MNGDMIAFIKVMDENDENVDIFSSRLEGGNMDYFHLIDENFEFHNYGFLIEKAHGEWKIIED